MDIYKPLNNVLIFFAYSYIKFDGVNLSLDWSKFKFILYILISTILNISFVYLKYYKNSFNFTFDDSIQIVYFISFVQYLFDYYCIFKYGNDIQLNYRNNYVEIDKTIGLPNYDNIKQRIKVFIIVSLFLDLFSAIFDAFAWILNYGFIKIAPNLISYFYYILNMLSITDIITNPIRMEYRLRIVGDILEKSTDNNYLEVNDIKTTLWSFHGESHILKLQTPEQHCQKVTQITRGYFRILEQCDYMNTMYGLRVRYLGPLAPNI